MPAGVIAPTAPFCGACGFDYERSGGGEVHNAPPVFRCDACGADLSFTDSDIGPSNPPSAASASDATGGVARFTYTSAPNFDSYNFRYTLDGGPFIYLTGAPATDSPIDIAGQSGVEVCGQLQGVTDGKPSPWAAEKCVTPA